MYLIEAPSEERQRLLGFERVELQPGESKTIKLEADPRLLARYDSAAGRWKIANGVHRVVLGSNAMDAARAITLRPFATRGGAKFSCIVKFWSSLHASTCAFDSSDKAFESALAGHGG